MSDPAERWSRLEALFHDASMLSPRDRLSFLQSQCGNDSTLFEQVAALVGAEAQIEDLEIAVREEGNGTRDLPQSDRRIGSRIGAFEIRERIGRGGMGVVYLGERCSEFAQTVAIKLMSMDLPSPLSQERFLKERSTLAGLQHRNIVRLLDGGMTDDGFPYIAMEHIRGRRIDDVCDDPATGTDQVISLMLQVCEAVSYVHRNMFLHRDLKPSNVLVTEENLVKLLDFGTFKSLVPTDASLTQPGMQALTVRYASPEHLLGGEVSTASDVFSLGMMLHRLLLGHLPQRLADLTIDKYLNTLAEETFDGVAEQLLQRRSIDRQLARDLEAIIRKALHFNAVDRYRDADALSGDLRAAVEGRPITAVHETRADRTIRLFRRNRASSILSLCTLVLLAASIMLMLRGSREIRAEQRRAETGIGDEARLTHFLLIDYFEQLKRIPGSTEAQRLAVSQALTYVDNLAPVAETPDLQADRVKAYTEMGSLLGNPYENNLGDTTGALRTLQKAVDLAHTLVVLNSRSQKYKQMEAEANLALGRTYFGNGDPHKAEVYLLKAVNVNADVVANGAGIDAAGLAEVASALDGLGDVYFLDGAVNLRNPSEALRRYQEAQRTDAKGLALDASCARCRRGVALEYWKIGMTISDPARAASVFESGLKTLDAFPTTELATARVRRMRTVILQKLGTSYLAMGRVEDSMQILNGVRADLQRSVAADDKDERGHFDLWGLDFNIAEYLDLIGTRSEALALDRELLAQADALVHLDPGNQPFRSHKAGAELRLGLLEVRYGDKVRGEALERDAMQLLEPMTHDPAATVEVLQLAADALVATHGEGNSSVQCAQRAIAMSSPPSGGQYLSLANAHLLAGNLDAAKSAAGKMLTAAGSDSDFVTKDHVSRAQAILHANSLQSARAILPGFGKAPMRNAN